MTIPITSQIESSPSTLFVRCTEKGHQQWALWGRPTAIDGIWRFDAPNETVLLDILDQLNASLPPGSQNEALAVVCPAHYPLDIAPLTLLADCQSLPVLLARRRHPWLMGDLIDLIGHVHSYLQPIVDLGRSGQLFAYEALCRGIAPDGTLLNGEQMFTLATRTHRLEALDTACQYSAIHTKARQLPGSLPLFVNILPGNLLTLDLQQEPWVNLPTLGIRPHEIVFEIVESEQFADVDALINITDQLRRQGFRIALDDLGSGYNGLTVLAKLRPDFIKLDRGLVHGVQGSQVRLALLQALISMAQRLGCAILAEGLERLEDIVVCRDLGVHFAQGYYFAPPSPEPVVPPLLPPQEELRRCTRMVQLREVVEPIPTLPLEVPPQQAREYFQQFPDRPTAVVLDDGKPVGYLTRRMAYSPQPAHGGLGRRCKLLDKRLPEQISARALLFRLYHDADPMQPWVVVDGNGDYIGILEPWMILTQMITGQPNEGFHPLSRLPTGPILRDTLDMHLRARKQSALVYIDLDHFKAFNDRYGFVCGDAMIMLLAELLKETFRKWPEAYLGHIGGDDFIALVPRDQADLVSTLGSLLTSFRGLAAYLYDNNDFKRGYFTTEDGSPHPTAAVSVVIVDGRHGQIADSLAASQRVAKLKKLAKARLGSVIAIDDDPPRFVSMASTAPPEYRWDKSAIRALLDIANQPRDRSQHDLDALFKRYPFFELIYELDQVGVQRYPNWVHPEMWGRIKGGGTGINRSDQPYFQLVAHSHAPYASNIYMSIASGEFCTTVAVPLYDNAEAFNGVLVADLNLTGLVGINTVSQIALRQSG